MTDATVPDIEQRPHVIALAYDEAEEAGSKKLFDKLSKLACRGSGVMRIQFPPGSRVMVACADDEAAACFAARLPWGPGMPVELPMDICTALVERRRQGEQRAQDTRDGFAVRTGLNTAIVAPTLVDSSILQLVAQNTAEQPWASVGGICGATCASYKDATHVRETIVQEHLSEIDGMVAVFGDERSAAVVGISDTYETDQLLRQEIESLAGPLDYEADAQAAWTLWVTRLKAGSGPLPMTMTGTADEAMDFLAGSGLSTKAKLHAPSRNQPCPCGSGKKYKKCCGA